MHYHREGKEVFKEKRKKESSRNPGKHMSSSVRSCMLFMVSFIQFSKKYGLVVISGNFQFLVIPSGTVSDATVKFGSGSFA